MMPNVRNGHATLTAHGSWQIFMGGMMMVLMGCGQDVATLGTGASDRQLWEISLNARAVTLSTHAAYNTMQLTVVPRDDKHVPISDASPAQFTVLRGAAMVAVNGTGLVTAKQPTLGTPAKILVKQTVGLVTKTDTVFVQVTADPTIPPRLATMTIRLPPQYAHTIPNTGIYNVIFFGFELPTPIIEYFDEGGTPIPDLIATFESSDSLIATVIDPLESYRQVATRKPGSVTITATAVAYGVTRHATLDLNIIPSRFAQLFISSRTPIGSRTPVAYLKADKVTVSAGAIVEFHNATSLPVDIVFDMPTGVMAVPDSLRLDGTDFGPGNITFAQVPMGTAERIAVRYFPKPGQYRFHSRQDSTLTGMVVVQ